MQFIENYSAQLKNNYNLNLKFKFSILQNVVSKEIYAQKKPPCKRWFKLQFLNFNLIISIHHQHENQYYLNYSILFPL